MIVLVCRKSLLELQVGYYEYDNPHCLAAFTPCVIILMIILFKSMFLSIHQRQPTTKAKLRNSSLSEAE